MGWRGTVSAGEHAGGIAKAHGDDGVGASGEGREAAGRYVSRGGGVVMRMVCVEK